jgi:tetratricopeptide (TPR) repeat protein
MGAVASAWQALRATSAEQAAGLSAAKAKTSESEALATLRFFQDKVLAAARPKDLDGGLGIEATIRQAVDAAEPDIEKDFADKPLVESSIRETLGETYRHLGQPKLTVRQHERSYALRQQVLGPDDPLTLIAMSNLALAFRDDGRLADALPLQKEDLRQSEKTLGPYDRGTLTSMNNLARLYHELGRPADALPLQQEQFKRCRATRGSDDADTLTSMNSLGVIYQDVGRLDEAEALQKECLKRSTVTRGPDHPGTLICMFNLAGTYRIMGRLEEALSLQEEELKRSRAVLGSTHPSTLVSVATLATGYANAGRLAAALPLYEKAVRGSKMRLGLDHPRTLAMMTFLGVTLLDAGRTGEALPMLEQTLTLRKTKLGVDHPDTLFSMNNLARARLNDDPACAEKLMRQCLEIRAKRDENDWHASESHTLLGASLLGQKRYAEAEPHLLNGYRGMKALEAKIPAPHKKRVAQTAQWIFKLYEAMGLLEKAKAWRAVEKKMATALPNQVEIPSTSKNH